MRTGQTPDWSTSVVRSCSLSGGRYWRYRYRFDGRENLISLGLYPEVPIESARARHHAARQLLALGVNPADRRKALHRISVERI